MSREERSVAEETARMTRGVGLLIIRAERQMLRHHYHLRVMAQIEAINVIRTPVGRVILVVWVLPHRIRTGRNRISTNYCRASNCRCRRCRR